MKHNKQTKSVAKDQGSRIATCVEWRTEAKGLGITALASLIIMLYAFSDSGMGETLRMWLSIMWLIVLPGYALTLHWYKELDIIERIIAGCMFAAAVIGLLSYYIGLAGIHVKIHGIVLPAVVIGISLYIFFKRNDLSKED